MEMIVSLPVRSFVLACLLLVPALARAQAEPAPEGYVPPGKEAPPPPPPAAEKNHLAANARLAVPLGGQLPGIPAVGFGAGVQLSRALVNVGRMRFGVGFDFGYLRAGDDFNQVANWTFAALGVLDGIFGRVRPWVAVGAGIAVGQFRQPAADPSMPPLAITGVLPLVQLSLGLDIAVSRGVEIGIGGEFDLTFSSLVVGSPPARPFDPGMFAARLGIGFRF
jgi:hypothetical protein